MGYMGYMGHAGYIARIRGSMTGGGRRAGHRDAPASAGVYGGCDRGGPCGGRRGREGSAGEERAVTPCPHTHYCTVIVACMLAWIVQVM
jgi:hypothetical protein